MTHPLAGKPAPRELLIDVAALRERFREVPPQDPTHAVSFGTSGHRGSALAGTFNEAHVAAIARAVAEHRRAAGVDGPLFLGKDTHALSAPAEEVVLDVLAAHGVEVVVDGEPVAATPVLSHAILAWNRGRTAKLADGIVVTPSHNPPGDGGIKYDPPTGGPADTETTAKIQARANELLRSGDLGPRARDGRAKAAIRDLTGAYVDDLGGAIDLERVAASGLKVGIDPLGGASLPVWERLAARLPLELVTRSQDPTFAGVTLDHDGQIRMDCSSPYAMAGLLAVRSRFDVAIGNDADADRHGIVVRGAGLLSPNHFLAVAVDYLFRARPGWRPDAGVGKTLVSSSVIDRVARELGRPLVEVPVGFKYFVPGLMSGTLGFGGEESAGASFLRKDGAVWTTDKDGILLGLLAMEIMAVTGEDPAARYEKLTERLGRTWYVRIDSPATAAVKAALKSLRPEAVRLASLGGAAVTGARTEAPVGGAIGGVKVETERGWFAARPSGTENVYKIYAESFVSEPHLGAIVADARAFVDGLTA